MLWLNLEDENTFQGIWRHQIYLDSNFMWTVFFNTVWIYESNWQLYWKLVMFLKYTYFNARNPTWHQKIVIRRKKMNIFWLEYQEIIFIIKQKVINVKNNYGIFTVVFRKENHHCYILVNRRCSLMEKGA